MNEHEVINWFIRDLGELTEGDFVVVGPGDDAAVLEVPTDQNLVVSTDTLVSGVHFPHGLRGDLVGYRSIAINVSDLAAMAATPLSATIALTVETNELGWLYDFLSGIRVAAQQYRLKIVGGNLAKGPMNVAVTVHGLVPKGAGLLRSGALLGDDIWVTGKVGATHVYLNEPQVPTSPVTDLLAEQDRWAYARYFLPHPRVAFAEAIRDIAHAAIDLSDGLVSDLAHVADASGLGAELHLERLPKWRNLDPVTVVGADDSYELLFCAAPDDRHEILTVAQASNTPVVVLGSMVVEKGVRFWLNGEPVNPPSGFDHFAS